MTFSNWKIVYFIWSIDGVEFNFLCTYRFCVEKQKLLKYSPDYWVMAVLRKIYGVTKSK